jgi:hypothetical protein
MSLEDFFVKVVAQIALNIVVRLIEIFFKGEYADEVVHSIHEWVRAWGYPRALRSAVRSLLNLQAPVAPRVPQILASMGALYLFSFWSWRVGTIALDWFAPFSVAAWATVVLDVARCAVALNGAILASAFASRLVICLVRRQQFAATRFVAIGASAFSVYMLASMFLSTTSAGNASVHTLNIPWAATVLVVLILASTGTCYFNIKKRTLDWADKIADRFFARFEAAPTANG